MSTIGITSYEHYATSPFCIIINKINILVIYYSFFPSISLKGCRPCRASLDIPACRYAPVMPRQRREKLFSAALGI
uniref:Uncharacterized protein n=1 Tax=Vibrio cholerae TaxID=666 RepID=Q0GPC1_VIBCL|nr:unknown [Vibrio cholerae]